MLKDKIKNKTTKYGVVGLGYVGLPLGIEFARVGIHVTGFEVDQSKVDSLLRGESYIEDVPSADVKRYIESGHFDATTDFDRFAEMDIISICVPTPLGKTRDPDMKYVQSATEAIRKRLRKDQLVILESTTYPGTTEELVLPELEKSGLVSGEDFYLAFSPERVDPSNPRFVSGELAQSFYSHAIDEVQRVSSASAAEMSKLLENTFRSVNIGLVNEVAIMCHRLGLDVWEIIDAAATKPFGFMKFVPGPGLGGHCIPIDPFYLSWKLRTLNYRARFIELAGEVNSEMPDYVMNLITDSLNDAQKSIRGSRIMILGVAYKADVSDMRESPAIDIMGMLQQRGADVVYHDPHVPSFSAGGNSHTSVELNDAQLGMADCVVVTARHKAIDWDKVAHGAKLIVDTRNAFPAGSPLANGTRVVRI